MSEKFSSTFNPNNNLWSPEQGSLGFKVEMLPDSKRTEPVSVESAFSTTEERAQYLLDRYNQRDGVRIIDTPNDIDSGEELLSLNVNVMLPTVEFQHALDVNKIDPGLLSEIADMPLNEVEITPEQAKRYKLVGTFPAHEATGLAESIAESAYHNLKPDWQHLPRGTVEHQKFLSQIIEFSSWGKKANLYNFTDTILTEEQVSKIAYALSEMAHRTGGAVMDMLEVMAILPNNDKELSINESEEHSSNGLARTHRGSVIFAEEIFEPASKEASAFRPEEISGDETPLHVPGDLVQRATFHELTHLVAENGKREDDTLSDKLVTDIGWEWDDGKVDNTGSKAPIRRGWTEAPTRYGRSNHREELAVIGEASFVGGEWFDKYDDVRRLAINGLFEGRHSRLQGPTLVTARELSLPNSAHKLGLPDEAPISILPGYNYMLYGPN